MSLVPSVGVDIYPPWKKHKLTVTIIDSSWLEGAYITTGLCVKSYGKAVIRENVDIHVVLISTSQREIFSHSASIFIGSPGIKYLPLVALLR